MAAIGSEPPLVVITGPTASGKSELALRLAKRWGGEIICADSRTVYKGLDVGTAKPSLADRAAVPHHLFDIVDPGESFAAADFKRLAEQAIDGIRGRGHVPFVVGGTGLYIEALLYSYSFAPPADPRTREKLERLSVDDLQDLCRKHNIGLPRNNRNKRHLVRWIETDGHLNSSKRKLLDNTIVVAIATDKGDLRTRIEHRAEHFLECGVIEEARRVGEEFGWDNEAMKGNIYPLIHQLLEKKISEQELIDKFTTLDWRLAKRQITWLKRNADIQWMTLPEAEKFLTATLKRVVSSACL
jgi:tRNA dimethylallyltransferase